MAEEERSLSDRSALPIGGDPVAPYREGWKARGRELNEIYDALTTIVQESAPGFDPVADLKALGAQRDRLRAENEAMKAAQCPDTEVCKTCPCAGEDDACFPGERLRAENERLREAARETLGAIEERWDGTEKSPLWGLCDALETALESDELRLAEEAE